MKYIPLLPALVKCWRCFGLTLYSFNPPNFNLPKNALNTQPVAKLSCYTLTSTSEHQATSRFETNL